MKQDWEKGALKQYCDFFNGKAHEKAIEEDGKYIVVNSKFISSDGYIKKFTNQQMFPLFQGDIVMVMSDVPNGKALAKCYLIDKDNTYSLNQRICAIRSEKFIKKYLFYHLNRHEFLLSFNNGENQTNLRKGDILNTPLKAPKINEQKRIVAKLDECFEAIDKARTNVEKNLNNAKELFQSQLNEIFSQKGDGWVEKKLGEVAEVIAGQSPKGKYYNDKGVGLPFYQGKKLFGEKHLDEPNTWSSVTTKESYAGDIVMSVRAPVGDVNFNYHKKICIGRGLAGIRAGETVNKDYLFYFLIHHKNKIVGNTGAVFNSINKTQISNIIIPMVDLAQQNAIVNQLDDLKSQTQSLESNYQQELDALDELKKSLLQKAFLGQLIMDNG